MILRAFSVPAVVLMAFSWFGITFKSAPAKSPVPTVKSTPAVRKTVAPAITKNPYPTTKTLPIIQKLPLPLKSISPTPKPKPKAQATSKPSVPSTLQATATPPPGWVVPPEGYKYLP